MIRQEAFAHPQWGWLKTSLHTHTTRSDGPFMPEETLRLYARMGYDAVALTDHRIYNRRAFAPETGVLVLPGIETDGGGRGAARGTCFHTVGIGGMGDGGFAQDERVPTLPADGPAGYQPMIDQMRAQDNFVIYAHPQWSRTPARAFEGLTGLDAMEIWNTGCAMENDMDVDNGFLWDELLRAGRRVWAVATDDGHRPDRLGGGWVMVNAHKDADDVLRALRAGAFYASCGPEIHDFYVQDGRAVVACSPAAYVLFAGTHRPWWVKVAAPQGPTTQAVFLLEGDDLPGAFVRAVVVDAQGRRAWTNPIFL